MIDYPIVGEWRYVLFPLEFIIVVIFLEISVYFFYKHLQNLSKSIPSFIEVNWGVIFLSFSISWIFFLFADYYYVNRSLILTLGYFSLTMGGLFFAYRIESSKTLNTKYFFTIFSVGTIIVLVTTLLIVPSMLQSVAALLSVPAYAILALYFFKVIQKIWVKFKWLSIGLIIGVFLWLFGYALSAQIFQDIFNMTAIRAIGDILNIFGILLISYFINTIPSLSEIGWQDKIKYIILTTHSGKCLYNENFKEKKQINEVLLAGYLSGVQIFLKTAMKSKSSLTGISKGEETFMVEEGESILGILIVEQELEILKHYLKKIVKNFEVFFQDSLKDWNGNVKLFQPTKEMINDIILINKM
ncbi:MAG: hypothetical protein ACTSVY_07730 [Candidatus Helarchaeota archaeon]